jgi:hypothetical protein
LSRGRVDDAERAFRDLLAQVHVADFEYEEWLRGLARVLERKDRGRDAAFVHLYLHAFASARQVLPADAHRERGRLFEQEKKPALAASEYARAGWLAHAGIQHELAGAWSEAARVWKGLLDDPRLQGASYERGLAHFNVARTLARAGAGDAGEADAHRHLVAAQQTLEAVADELETRGQGERAFYCYAVVLRIGRESGSFENLCEGYLNCVRVLRQDNLKFYALQYYEDFLRLAIQREEYHTAATLYKEAADYSRSAGLPYDRHYLGRAGEVWLLAAQKNEREGGPVELSENATLVAIECMNGVGRYAAIADAYRSLAALPLSEARQHRYARMAERYEDARSEQAPAPAFPEYLRQPHAYTPLWHTDLLEWELGGDPVEVCASVVGKLSNPDAARRRALLALLRALDAERSGSQDTLGQVALALGEVQSYTVLSPLERLATHRLPSVRAGVMRALRYLFYKRSFVILEPGLLDANPQVRRAALESLRQLHFPAAFHPLARIVRDHSQEEVRAAALESLGHITSLEAGEFLIDVIRREEQPLRDLAARALMSCDNPDVLPILRRHAEGATGPARRVMETVLAQLHLPPPGS